MDTTEQLHFHFSLSCIGEGNGNPLQCSCLENPRDSGAWWAAVYGVTESRTRLKRLSSSSSKRWQKVKYFNSLIHYIKITAVEKNFQFIWCTGYICLFVYILLLFIIHLQGFYVDQSIWFDNERILINHKLYMFVKEST